MAAKTALIVSSALAGVAMGVPALPAEGPTQAAPLLEEIVVSAARREQSVQDVPAAVNAYSGAQLESFGVKDTLALQYLTPGLSISRDQAVNNIYIRGIGSSILGIASGNSVATYVDGAFVPQSAQVFQAFNDIERVEVLKGPQATLYGRNATGGAINIVSRDPEPTFSGNTDLSLGNFDAYDVRGTVNAPLSERVAVRVSAFRAEHEGYTDNLSGGRNDALDQYGIRAALKFAANQDFDLVVRMDYTKSDGTEGGVKTPDSRTTFYTVPRAGYPQAQYIADPRKVRSDIYENRMPIEQGGAGLSARWDTSLGELKLTSSYRRFELGPQVTDLDGTELDLATVRWAEMTSNSLYNELLLDASPSDGLRLLVGATAFSDNAYQAQGFDRLVLPVSALASLGIHQLVRRDVDTSAYSAFVDAEYDVTDRLTLLAGARYSEETKDFVSNIRTSFCVNTAALVCTPGPLPSAANVSNSKSWSNTSPRFGLRFKASDAVLWYLTATMGFKSGGFNITNPLNSFNPEEVWSVEGGVKSSFADDRVILNVSAFSYDYRDLQVTQLNPQLQPVITNASEAEVYGVDADLAWRLGDLTLGANAEWLQTEFGSLVLCNERLGACPGTGTGSQYVNVQGRSLPIAPEVSGTLYADYTMAFERGSRLDLHGDAYYRSRTYYTQFEDDFVSQGAFWMLNARATLTLPGDQWSVSLWGRNLTDELVRDIVAVSGVPPQGDAAGDIKIERYAPPRTFGVTVAYRF